MPGCGPEAEGAGPCGNSGRQGRHIHDIVARKPDGTLQTHKLLSENPERYSDAAVQGIREILGLASDDPIPEGAIETVRMARPWRPMLCLSERAIELSCSSPRDCGTCSELDTRTGRGSLTSKSGCPNCSTKRCRGRRARRRPGVHRRAPGLSPGPRGACKAYGEGFRSVAVALMHGYRFREHEAHIGEMARQQGFTQVSLSPRGEPAGQAGRTWGTRAWSMHISPPS